MRHQVINAQLLRQARAALDHPHGRRVRRGRQWSGRWHEDTTPPHLAPDEAAQAEQEAFLAVLRATLGTR
jgi:hypothetical protein